MVGKRPVFRARPLVYLLMRPSLAIVGIHGGKGEEIAGRAGRDDVGHIARSQGNRAAGADEPLHLGTVKPRASEASLLCSASLSPERQCLQPLPPHKPQPVPWPWPPPGSLYNPDPPRHDWQPFPPQSPHPVLPHP